MSANSDYNMRPSWIKDNLSQILLLVAMLVVVVSLAVYFFAGFLSEFMSEGDGAATKNLAANEQPSEIMTENWGKDPLDVIENTQLSVGASDLNEKRIVISKEELIGLEERYIVDVVDVAKTPSAQQPETQTQQNNNAQPNLSIIKMNEPVESPIAPLNGQDKSIVNQQAGIALPKAAQQNNTLERILTPVDILLAKPPHLFTLKLSELETQAQLLAFIGQHDLPEENLYIYQTSRNKQPRFVIIFGEYEGFSAAKRAQQSLSASLSNLPLAIVIYQEIHQDLQLNND